MLVTFLVMHIFSKKLSVAKGAHFAAHGQTNWIKNRKSIGCFFPCRESNCVSHMHEYPKQRYSPVIGQWIMLNPDAPSGIGFVDTLLRLGCVDDMKNIMII